MSLFLVATISKLPLVGIVSVLNLLFINLTRHDVFWPTCLCASSYNLLKILQQAGKQVPDWLESLGDDALGTQFGGASGHTNDIRSFKSLAINDSKPGSGAAAAADEDW